MIPEAGDVLLADWLISGVYHINAFLYEVIETCCDLNVYNVILIIMTIEIQKKKDSNVKYKVFL